MMDLDELKEFSTGIVERITHPIAESGEDVLPIAFTFYHNGAIDICGMVFTPETKKKVMREVAAISLDPQVDAMVMLTDTFILQTSDKRRLEQVMEEGVKCQPDRQEALVLMVVKENQIVAAGTQVYQRIPESHKIRWQDWMWSDQLERWF